LSGNDLKAFYLVSTGKSIIICCWLLFWVIRWFCLYCTGDAG